MSAMDVPYPVICHHIGNDTSASCVRMDSRFLRLNPCTDCIVYAVHILNCSILSPTSNTNTPVDIGSSAGLACIYSATYEPSAILCDPHAVYSCSLPVNELPLHTYSSSHDSCALNKCGDTPNTPTSASTNVDELLMCGLARPCVIMPGSDMGNVTQPHPCTVSMCYSMTSSSALLSLM